MLAACGDGGVSVAGVWARATPGAVTTGAVYLEIAAPGGDVLTGVSVDPSVAAAAEIHETVAVGSSMTMRPVAQVPVPDGETVVFAPGGFHVMLVDLAAPLTPGAVFPLRLTFATAGEEVVEVEVRLDPPGT